MTTSVATKAAKTAAPKPKAPASAPKPAANPAPEAKAEAKVEAPAPTKGGNSNYAAESVRNELAAALKKLTVEEGWTRPMISKLTGFTDSQVWRGYNLKVHQSEMDTWKDFLSKVTSGEYKADKPARKPKADDLQAKIDAALTALGTEAKTVAQYRKVLEDAKAALSA